MAVVRIEGDPPVRKDGRCARPGCKEERKPNSKYGQAFEDPFCSTECCRFFWGTTAKVEATRNLE